MESRIGTHLSRPYVHYMECFHTGYLWACTAVSTSDLIIIVRSREGHQNCFRGQGSFNNAKFLLLQKFC